MRHIFPILLGLTLLTAPAALGQSSALPAGEARIYVDEVDFDFGFLPNDAFVSHSYKIYSRGKDPLRILGVKPACGCTKAPLAKEVIAPGDSGEVELIFHIARGQRGRTDKSATVTCNDSERQTVTLRFRGNMYPTERPDSLTPVSLSQSKVSWMYGQPINEQIITLKNVTDTPIRLTPIALPRGFADVTIPKDEIKPGKTRDIRVKMAKEFVGKDFQKSFTFECSDVAKTRFTVPVLLDAPISSIAPQLTPAAAPQNESAKGGSGSH